MKKLRKGLLFSLLSSFFIGIILVMYISGDPIVALMDVAGWVFFVTSCLGHAALFCMVAFLLFYLPWIIMKRRMVATGLLVGCVSMIGILAFINMQVYKIYRFHINGFIINMLSDPKAAGDIFDFDAQLLLTEALMLCGIVVVCMALWWAAGWMNQRIGKRTTIALSILLGASLLVANVIHIYGAFVLKPSVLQSARLVPYYFPLSASSLMQKMGFERKVMTVSGGMNGSGTLCYPLHPIKVDTARAQRPNILFILIDSWSKRALTKECMPQLFQLAHEEQWYDNHVSCSNGTRYAMFGMFTGVQPYYWTAFEAGRVSPVLVDQLLAADYQFEAFPSATLENPPFHRVLFQNVPQLRTSTEGKSAFERDQRIKDDLIAHLPELKKQSKPFFSFIFFDLLHAYSLPKKLLNRFQPSWEFGDFTKLNNDMDPTPFWNLYRNSAYQVDLMVGELIARLKALDMYDNTLIFITGDHAQEYNENHKNYWGHNSNFSTYQIGVPLIIHEPGKQPRRYQHRTTHYDFVPTIMTNCLGVTNEVSDYSAGRLISDTTPRLWHFVGNELRYAFLVEGDTILTKEGGGWIEVTDAQLNPVDNYHISPRQFDKTIKSLNRYFK